ncbi:recombinase family protein [Methylobacterium indicum]|uniref:Resolvase n=1 Tax=Methylobacterium indicum TaxID=1775910 RepID=A0ABR5HIX4_9HYPH|nr:recombinase family protein [Methylobacterium indicum]KMO20362.1 resolvase [Methylobacterium indicum]KMO26679.1 resolvase [Methylobacterium indicum]
MAEGRFVSYLRVSTAKQGASGLGLEAQRKAVTDFLNGGRWTLVTEVVEVESGKRADRPKLAEALRLCRLHGATLVIAKLDRLSRDAHFLLGLQRAGVRFVAADMPEANEMVVGIMAVVAQAERKMISARTKAALAAAKERGVKLGGPTHHLPAQAGRAAAASASVRSAGAKHRAEDLARDIAELRAKGATSLRELAAGLDRRGLTTSRGATWTATAVRRVLAQLA